ncbi:hypothetical protein FE257_012665 [Aspergillus nanangensis]|uniref:Major facilitator superfamily (MFS) profile domain-containing protein n=1 Tax=Aspergillus nanangensis TaxID=2582783 RepID=A0AAD4CG77_ASPNN|nr:hypothetical protein FE257_012665 [Aspergillus nanangensis]
MMSDDRHNNVACRPTANRSHKRVIGYCLIVGIAICTFGIDNGETNFGYFDSSLGAYNMTAGDETRMYGIELGFALLGSLAAGSVGTRYGRKAGLVTTALLNMLGAGLQMISYVPGLLVGRAVMGMGVGFAGVFAIAYWSEVAPTELRGQLVIFYQILISIATFVGAAINQGTHAKTDAMSYRIPLLVAVLVPFSLLVLVWIVPESPRWLVTKGRIADAKINLAKIRGSGYTPEEVDREMEDVLAIAEMQRELEASTSFLDCFRGSDLRRTVIAVTLFCGEQGMGIGFIGAYLTYFFALTGYTNAFVITVISSACAIAGSLSSIFSIQYFGRRTILIVGAAVNCFCMLAFATISVAAPDSPPAAKSLIAFICIFNFTYSASWGPVVPVIAGEIPSNRLRSKSLGLSVGGNWTCSMIVICAVPYLIGAEYANLGTKIGFIFGGLTVPLLIFTILFVPETKGRTLEEIDEMFLKRIPMRQFKHYVCTGTVDHTGGQKADVEMIENAELKDRGN